MAEKNDTSGSKATAGENAPRTALAITDDISKFLVQATAIMALIGHADKTKEWVPDAAVSNAAWAGRDLVKQARVLVGELYALKAAELAAGVTR